MLTIITLDTNNALNIANAITAINITGIGYSVEGVAGKGKIEFIFEDLTGNQKQKLIESLNMNNIQYHIE